MDKLEPGPDSLITYHVDVDQGVSATVTIAGELDMSSIDPLAAEVDEALATGLSRLIVDVGAVRFADSSAIALWVRWASAVTHFELRHPPPLLKRVIAAMGLAEKLGSPA